ncbi:hypothetical protein EFB08_00450 [Rufibacter latericius]|uniref:Uncharacterized protein n=1 Tax=Rufibacter latericius TaxID=2487040 RepID=A0A3M9N1Y7_9BACT|nr:hypothetical protein EFB08_00450 [Rufibacter latericius]
MKQKTSAKWYEEVKKRLSERQRVFFFLILLVTFLIREKSDKRWQSAAAALRLGKKELESKGL